MTLVQGVQDRMPRFLGSTPTVTSGNGTNSSNSTHSGGHHNDHITLLFPFLMLTTGVALKELSHRIHLPYTVVLCFFGMIMGVVFRYYATNIIAESSLVYATIDPHLLLYAFLPPLIFESAFSIEWHIFKKTAWNCALLAGPGLLIATSITGLTSKIFYSSWSWETCILFGAILSATDPVAVVALLKDLGASKKLATVIEGESLMNDGTAVVIFNVFLKAVQEGELSEPGSIIGTFCWMAFVGPIFGVVMGVISVHWLGMIFNEDELEISISLATAYLTFFLAEESLKVSGVLAVVGLGIYYGFKGRTSISPEVYEFLHKFWEYLAFVANTLIFIMTGLIITNSDMFQTITVFDIGMLPIIYIVCHIARGCTFTCLYPAMRRIGYGTDFKQCCIAVYGGLRGAVGLALALIVKLDPKLKAIDESIGNRFLFHCSGIVILTLSINSTTIPRLIRYFKMDRVPLAKDLIFKNAIKNFEEEGQLVIKGLQANHLYESAHWAEVRNFRFKAPKNKVAFFKRDTDEHEIELQEVTEARRRFLVTVRSSYWEQFNGGLVGREAVTDLVELTETSIDNDCDMGGEWVAIEQMNNAVQNTYLKKLFDYPIAGYIARRITFHDLKHLYDVVCCFSVAREDALSKMEHFLASEKFFEDIKLQALNDIEEAKKLLLSLQRTFPEISSCITTIQAARTVLNKQRAHVHHLSEEGMLDAREVVKLTRAIEAQMKRLLAFGRRLKVPTKEDLMSQMQFLENLSDDLVQTIIRNATEIVFEKGQILVKEGDPTRDIYLIARGTLEAYLTHEDEEIVIDELGIGAFFGEMAWATEAPAFATIRASSDGHLYCINAEHLKDATEKSEKLRNNLWLLAGRRIAESLVHLDEYFNYMTKREIREWVCGWTLFFPRETCVARCRSTVVLINGTAQYIEDETVQRKPSADGRPKAKEAEDIPSFTLKNEQLVTAPALLRSNSTRTNLFKIKLFEGARLVVPKNAIFHKMTLGKALWRDAMKQINRNKHLSHLVNEEISQMRNVVTTSSIAESLAKLNNKKRDFRRRSIHHTSKESFLEGHPFSPSQAARNLKIAPKKGDVPPRRSSTYAGFAIPRLSIAKNKKLNKTQTVAGPASAKKTQLEKKNRELHRQGDGQENEMTKSIETVPSLRNRSLRESGRSQSFHPKILQQNSLRSYEALKSLDRKLKHNASMTAFKRKLIKEELEQRSGSDSPMQNKSSTDEKKSSPGRIGKRISDDFDEDDANAKIIDSPDLPPNRSYEKKFGDSLRLRRTNSDAAMMGSSFSKFSQSRNAVHPE